MKTITEKRSLESRRPRMARWMSLVVGLAITLGYEQPFSSAETLDPRDTASPYGVLDFFAWDKEWSHQHYTPKLVAKAAQLMEEAGVRIVRMDFLWDDIEPEKGRFDFSKYDRILDELDQYKIKVLAILEYNPRWRNAEWNAAPDPDAYVFYARATVRHFKARVKYWEIWNEPDTAVYWKPQDGLTSYAHLLKMVYPAIKDEDPTARVVLGGMTDDGPFSLRHIYQKAGRDCFDIVNIHPFVNPLKPTALQQLHGLHNTLLRMMTRFGDAEKPIWYTELGCPGVTTPTSANSWWNGRSPTEVEQAEWVRTIYQEPLRWKGVQKIFWAFFRETPDVFHNGVDNFGLVRNDFSEKPAYRAYKNLSRASTKSSPSEE